MWIMILAVYLVLIAILASVVIGILLVASAVCWLLAGPGARAAAKPDRALSRAGLALAERALVRGRQLLPRRGYQPAHLATDLLLAAQDAAVYGQRVWVPGSWVVLLGPEEWRDTAWLADDLEDDLVGHLRRVADRRGWVLKPPVSVNLVPARDSGASVHPRHLVLDEVPPLQDPPTEPQWPAA
jgi:hypothetical protein